MDMHTANKKGKALFTLLLCSAIAIVLMIILLSNTLVSGSLSYNGTPLIDSTNYSAELNICYAQRNNFNVTVTPCVQQDINGEDITQYVTFGWNGTQTKNVSMIFVYEGDLDYGKIEVQKNVTEQYTDIEYENAYVIDKPVDFVSYVNLGTPSGICGIGNLNNTMMFNITRTDGLTETYCFSDYNVVNSSRVLLSGNYDKPVEVQKERNITTFVDVSDKVEYLGKNLLGFNYSYYKTDSITFYPNENHLTKWTYTPANSSRSGKWHILGYETEYGLINSVIDDKYLYLDPAWNASWSYARNITFDEKIINLTYITGMNADFSDIRFLDTATESVEQDYWIESYVSGVSAIVHSKLGGTQRLYYGNPTASSTSNIDNVYYGLKVYYTFNEAGGTIAYDRVGRWNATSIDSLYNATGKSFNDYMADDTNAINTTFMFANVTGVNNYFTIIIFLKRTGNITAVDGETILSNSHDGGTAQNGQIKIFSDNGIGNLKAYAKGGSSLVELNGNASELGLDRWSMIGLSYDGSVINFTLDGNQLETTSQSFNTYPIKKNMFMFGNGFAEYGNNFQLDEVMFYNHSFNQSEFDNLQVISNGTYSLTAEESETIIYPTFTNITTSPSNGTNYSSGATYIFYTTISDSNGTAGVEFSGVNYSLSNDTYLYNKTFIDLSAGTYSYYYWSYGNGTLNNYNISSTYTFTINKTSAQTGLTFDLASPQYNNTAVTPTCSVLVGDGTVVLQRNGTTISSGSPITMPSGNHTFNCSVASTQNYTYAENISNYTINSYIFSIIFVNPTPSNNSNVTSQYYLQNASLNSVEQIRDINYSINGTNYSLFDKDLLAYWTFNNISNIGENSTYAVDISGHGNNLTINNFTNWGLDYGISEGGYSFSGDNLTEYGREYMRTTGMIVNGTNNNWTTTLWINPHSAYHAETNEIISVFAWNRLTISDAGILTFTINTWNGTDQIGDYQITDTIDMDVWHFVAMQLVNETGSNLTMKLYVDGSQIGTKVVAGSPRDISYQNVEIGSRGTIYSGAWLNYNGSIDNIMLWNRSLSANEINVIKEISINQYNYTYYNVEINRTNSLSANNDYIVSAYDGTSFKSTSILHIVENHLSIVFLNFSNLIGTINDYPYGANTHGDRFVSGGASQSVDTNFNNATDTASNETEHANAWIASGLNLMRWDMGIDTYYGGFGNENFELWKNVSLSYKTDASSLEQARGWVTYWQYANGTAGRTLDSHTGQYAFYMNLSNNTYSNPTAYIGKTDILFRNNTWVNFSVWVKSSSNVAVYLQDTENGYIDLFTCNNPTEDNTWHQYNCSAFLDNVTEIKTASRLRITITVHGNFSVDDTNLILDNGNYPNWWRKDYDSGVNATMNDRIASLNWSNNLGYLVMLIESYTPKHLANISELAGCYNDYQTNNDYSQCAMTDYDAFGQMVADYVNWWSVNYTLKNFILEGWNEPDIGFWIPDDATDSINKSIEYNKMYNATQYYVKQINSSIIFGGAGMAYVARPVMHQGFVSNFSDRMDFDSYHYYSDTPKSAFISTYETENSDCNTYNANCSWKIISEWNMVGGGYDETNETIEVRLLDGIIYIMSHHPENVSLIFYQWTENYAYGYGNSEYPSLWDMFLESAIYGTAQYRPQYYLIANVTEYIARGSDVYGTIIDDKDIDGITSIKGNTTNLVLLNTGTSPKNIIVNCSSYTGELVDANTGSMYYCFNGNFSIESFNGNKSSYLTAPNYTVDDNLVGNKTNITTYTGRFVRTGNEINVTLANALTYHFSSTLSNGTNATVRLNSSLIDCSGISSIIYTIKGGQAITWSSTDATSVCNALTNGTGYSLAFNQSTSSNELDFVQTFFNITLISPENNSQDTDGLVRFSFNVTNNVTSMASCSLKYQFGTYTTSTSVSTITTNVIEVTNLDSSSPLYMDDLQWYISCADSLANTGSSTVYHLDTRPDFDNGEPTGGGNNPPEGNQASKNPKTLNVFYPEKWGLGQTIEVRIQAINQSDDIYKPEKVKFEFEINGIILQSTEQKDNGEVIAKFEVSDTMQKGNQTIKLIVEDERTLEQNMNFIVDDLTNIGNKKSLFEQLWESDLKWIIIVLGALLFIGFLILIVIIILGRFSK